MNILSYRLPRAVVALGLMVLFLAAPVQAQHTGATAHPDHVMVTPDDYTWKKGPASLPPGSRVMVIEGNPAEAGPFTLRLWFPADYMIAPHTHPADEHVTVISGALYMGLGATVDQEAARVLPAGSFAMMQAGTVHYAFTEHETIIQLHGIGPWGLSYLKATDDPRSTR